MRFFDLRSLLFVLLAGVCATSYADWQLDNENSSLYFVTIKGGDIAEIHTFDRLSGQVIESGVAEVNIDLASINTNIEIRDERMREHLFETKLFPRALITAKVPIKDLAGLSPGEQKAIVLDGTLGIHGVEIKLETPVTVTMLEQGALTVVNDKPVIINAGSVNLADGVEKLRELAGLPAISQGVSVDFSFSFVKE